MGYAGRGGVRARAKPAILLIAGIAPSLCSAAEPGRDGGRPITASAAPASNEGRGEGTRGRSTALEAISLSEAGDLSTLDRAAKNEKDPATRAMLQARAAAARLDLPGTLTAFRRGLRAGASPEWTSIGLATLAGVAFAGGGYAEAARASGKWLSLPSGTDPLHASTEMSQLHGLAVQLAALPRQALLSPVKGSTITWRDKAGLLRTRVRIGGVDQEVVLDTGANLSVVTSSAAGALGLRVLGSGSVRSSSRDAVAVRIAVAPRIRIGDTVVTNVKFLVLDDAALTMPLPGGYSIPAIIGFPVFRALGRATFQGDRVLLGGPAAGDTHGEALVASGSDLFAPASVNGLEVPLHLDSGASRTALSARFAAEHAEAMRGLPTRTSRAAGAGGSSETPASVLAGATVEVAGFSASLPEIEVRTGTDRENYGTLGQDVLRSARSYTLDLRHMRLVLRR